MGVPNVTVIGPPTPGIRIEGQGQPNEVIRVKITPAAPPSLSTEIASLLDGAGYGTVDIPLAAGTYEIVITSDTLPTKEAYTFTRTVQ